MSGEWHVTNLQWNDRSIFFREISGDREKPDSVPARQWELPNQGRKRYSKSLLLYSVRATPALILYSCREPCGRQADVVLLQGQKNNGKICLDQRCLRGIRTSFINRCLSLHIQNLALSTVGVLIKHAKRKILKLFLRPHCYWCWNTEIMYHYLGNYGVQCHTSTIQMKRRKGEKVGGKEKDKWTRSIIKQTI